MIFAAAIATVLVNPAQQRIQSWSENGSSADLVKLRNELPECARDMRETASLTELLDDLLARIEDGVRTTRVAAMLGGASSSRAGFDRGGAGLVGRRADRIARRHLRGRRPDLSAARAVDPGARRQPLGTILIGPRPDGSVLSKEEQKTLVEVAEPVARAIRNVIKREKRESAWRR